MASMEANPIPNPAQRTTRRHRTAAAVVAGSVVATTLALVAPARPASAEYLLSFRPALVSRTNAGGPVPAPVDDVSISGNGRFVAFTTTASMVASDTNGKADVYVRDRWAAVTELVSQTTTEQPVQGDSDQPTLSDDGRYVTFTTKAANLIAGDDKGFSDVFVRDRYAGTTTRVTIGVGGALLDNHIQSAMISGNGRHVVFTTNAVNVVANDTNLESDAFVRDLQTNTTERVSLTAVDGQANGSTGNATISDDGRRVAFDHSSLIAGGVIGEYNVYVRDRTAGTTELVNLRSDETVPDDWAASPSISGNGNVVMFTSGATNLVGGDTNGKPDVFVRDLTAGTTELVSDPDISGQFAEGAGTVPRGINDDGSRVLFNSLSRGTAAADVGGDYDVFQRNRTLGRTTRITTSTLVPDPASNSVFASTDDIGRSVAFAITPKLTSDAALDQAYVTSGIGIGAFTSAEASIDQLYVDFLGRTATTYEKAAWQSAVLNGAADLATLVAQLNATPAWADSRAPMVRLYWAYFLRRPDAGGLTYWLERYQAGTSLSKIAQSFAQSSEFKNRYGNVANDAYVKLVYQNVFERQPDADGLAYWTGRLNAKSITRGGVIVAFSESSEGKRRLAGPTNITLISLAMLRTVPSATLWSELYPTIDAGEPQAAWIGRQIVASPAYFARFD
jgi:hypothetical protein